VHEVRLLAIVGGVVYEGRSPHDGDTADKTTLGTREIRGVAGLKRKVRADQAVHMHGAHMRRVHTVARVALISCGLALVLAACSTSLHPGSLLVDPAKYDLYDCAQLKAENANLQEREQKLRALMVKAQDGAIGPAVAEIAYGPDYAEVSKKLRDVADARRQRSCGDVIETSVTTTR
jgi:cell division protein FtsB